MSEKIVQLNEEVIKGQLKELVRGCTSVKHRLHFWMLARRPGKAVWVRCGG